MATFKPGRRNRTRYNGGVIRQTLGGAFVGEVNTNGNRHRSPPFSDEQAAKAWINNRLKAKDEHGKEVLAGAKSYDAKNALSALKNKGLSVSLKDAAESYAKAIESLRRAGLSVSLEDVAEFYARHHQRAAEAWTVAETLDRYLAEMEHPQDGASPARPRSVENKRNRLKTFVEAHGGAKVPEITAGDVEAWLESTGAQGRNLRNYKGEVQSLFNYAAARMPGGYQNTVATFPTARAKERKPAEIVEPRHVKAVLHWLERESPRAAVGTAIGCFAGLRTSEITHGGGLQWTDVDFEEGVIKVPAKLSKTRDRREVKILPNLMQWLVRYRQGEGRITPPQTRVLAWRREAIAATGAHWPENGARHSFGTYFAKLNGYRAAADMLGHVGGIRMLMDHYSGTCTRAQAEQYFNITPAEPGKVIPLKQARA